MSQNIHYVNNTSELESVSVSCNLSTSESSSSNDKDDVDMVKVLIAGDSMVNQLDENRLSRQNVEVKVRYWGGCIIEDMYSNLDPILLKDSYDYVILHVGKLKPYIEVSIHRDVLRHKTDNCESHSAVR